MKYTHLDSRTIQYEGALNFFARDRLRSVNLRAHFTIFPRMRHGRILVVPAFVHFIAEPKSACNSLKHLRNGALNSLSQEGDNIFPKCFAY